MDNVREKIRQTILDISDKKHIPIENIILFGSRARGDFNSDSDYDILVITKDKLEQKLKFDMAKSVRQILARYYIQSNIPTRGTDVIIKSKADVDNYKHHINSIINSALKEGIVLC